MKRLSLSFLFIFSLAVVLFSACKDNKTEVTPDAPTIQAPSGVVQLQPGTDTTITFSVDVPGGYASSTVTASAGTATKSAEPATGATSGDLKVGFSPGESTGAVVITVTVTDNNQKTNTQNATVNITATPEPEPKIKDVFASADGVGNVTWSKDTTYILRGFIYVNDGQTLTIEPGTVIKGQPGQGAGASALIVAQGGKIMAEGTADAPIIFTGLADDLNGSVPEDANALWGGIIILGKAATNNNDVGGVKSIEGIPTDEPRGQYGGGTTPANDDNSGVLKYVSIRHGGSLIGSDNEINGLSLGAVGSGTVIDHVEIYSNLDDGIEFFGGTVNVKNVVIAYPGDDGLDMDEGFSGTVQNAIVWATGATLESDDPRGMELDGGVGANEDVMPYATPKIANVTLFFETGDSGINSDQAIYMRDNFAGSIYNSIAYGYSGPVDMERRTDLGSAYDRYTEGTIVISNNIFYNINTVTDPTKFADLFVISQEPDPTLEANAEADLSSKNTIVDPGFGTGAAKFTPSAAEVTANLATGLPGGLQDLGYKGAVDPAATSPYFANWTRTWAAIGQ